MVRHPVTHTEATDAGLGRVEDLVAGSVSALMSWGRDLGDGREFRLHDPPLIVARREAR